MATYDIRYDIPTEQYEGILRDIVSSPTRNLKSANFGCGPMIWEGWHSYDKYYKHEKVINVDMLDESIESNNFDVVFSSHSLEHNYFHLAQKTLLNWHRILKTGGTLHLTVPDLENTMKIMLDERTSFELKYEWYMYTMFGYQVSPDIGWKKRTLNDPVDPGQIHYCGFTKEWLGHFLTKIGFMVECIHSFNGYDTPSLYLKATKF